MRKIKLIIKSRRCFRWGHHLRAVRTNISEEVTFVPRHWPIVQNLEKDFFRV